MTEGFAKNSLLRISRYTLLMDKKSEHHRTGREVRSEFCESIKHHMGRDSGEHYEILRGAEDEDIFHEETV